MGNRMNVEVSEKITHEELQDWINRLAILRKSIQANGDDTNSEKVVQLINKINNREFSIGFCGHFSAGKSSMINELWEENLLPSSPIPTSANLVKVKSGEPWARIYFKKRNAIQLAYPYDIEKVKQYCLDGDEVESVEISHPSTHFPNDVVILDTPGVDSTDDAHRVATTSSLHLADVVFYVMDYNHVQSELNFQFAKEIKEQGKKVYFVINQIDKHHESELSFADFKQGVLMAFRYWNIEPDGIFYTSLKQEQHANNELAELKAFLHTLITEKDLTFIENVQNAAASIIDEHYHWLKATHEDDRKEIQASLAQLTDEERKNIKKGYADAYKQLEILNNQKQAFEDETKTELAKILKSAILMPYETRELAKAYLESTQPKFKVGLLFSKNKTEAERERRADAFYTSFLEQATSQLDWHIKQLLVAEAKKFQIDDQELFTSIYNEKIEIPISILREQVRTGASLNGDYLLKYAEDVAEEARRVYRAFANAAISKLLAALQTLIDEQSKQLREFIDTNSEIIHALEEAESISQVEHKIDESLRSILTEQGYASSEEIKEARQALPGKEKVEIISEQPTEEKSEDELVQAHSNTLISEEQSQSSLTTETDSAATVQKLKQVANEIKAINGLTAVSHELTERAKRFENKRYTVALFGAFSAGKSSFANALMGEKVLPVSPNPTTATINKILPVDQDHPHGTVIVKMKSNQDLLDDIQASLQLFGVEVESLDTIEDQIAAIKVDNLPPKAKPHYSFLRAVEKGIQFYRGHTGHELSISLDEFQSFVADEEKACFVEWIELYYDCPFTRKGMSLVDTPGADSINARHTGVAFEYIKNADAILFVTYYNHAFSHADKEFLLQLGRVKDVFELDKMFFIVNAADLASSDEEMAIVINHVADNLLQHGIRQPRIFPISSQLALLAKKGQQATLTNEDEHRLASLLRKSSNQDVALLVEEGYSQSKIEKFEEAFQEFTERELMEAAVVAATIEIERVSETLRHWIRSAQESQDVRQQKKLDTEKTYKKALAHVNSLDITLDKQALVQEIEELIFYVKQRIFLRFRERFQYVFNPAVLQNDNQSMKEKLQLCLKELVDVIEFDLGQEMRATALRIEAFTNKRSLEVFSRLEQKIHEEALAEFLHSFEVEKVELPEFHKKFDTIHLSELSPILQLFKNPKQFFEQNGQQEMREKLEEAFNQPVDKYLAKNLDRFSNYYVTVYEQLIEDMQYKVTSEVNEYFTGMISILSKDVDIEQLETAYRRIRTF